MQYDLELQRNNHILTAEMIGDINIVKDGEFLCTMEFVQCNDPAYFQILEFDSEIPAANRLYQNILSEAMELDTLNKAFYNLQKRIKAAVKKAELHNLEVQAEIVKATKEAEDQERADGFNKDYLTEFFKLATQEQDLMLKGLKNAIRMNREAEIERMKESLNSL